jgi:hypothetical protein
VTESLPVTPGALVAIAVVFVIAVGGYAGLVAPKRRAMTQLEAQVNAASRLAAAVPAPPIDKAERASWQEIETNVRGRFVAPENQLRLLVQVARLARATDLNVTDLQLQDSAGAQPSAAGKTDQVVTLPFVMPANTAVNPGIIRLTARNRYRDLIAFLDRVDHNNPYLAVQSLVVRRGDDALESDIRLVSLRWTK